MGAVLGLAEMMNYPGVLRAGDHSFHTMITNVLVSGMGEGGYTVIGSHLREVVGHSVLVTA